MNKLQDGALAGLKRGIQRQLHEISIELTSKCNLTCEMCSVWKGRRDGIPRDLVRAILTDARHLGAEVFTPSGAEVFMRKDTVEILQDAAQLGYSDISIVTNGMLIAHHIGRLKEIEGLQLHISIDGPEEVHDALRGDGSYRVALDGARLAASAGIPVSLKGVLMRPTLDNAGHIITLARELGLARVSYQPFQPEIAGPEEDHSQWTFFPEDRERVTSVLISLLDAARMAGLQVYTEALFPEIVPYIFDGVRPIPDGGCNLPSRFLLVDGRGDTYPCFFMREQSMGNVTKGVRLRDIWFSPVKAAMQARGLQGHCPGCLAGCSDVDSFVSYRKPA